MSSSDESSHQADEIAGALTRALQTGAVVALATVVFAPRRTESVGAKLLYQETGARTNGTTGDGALDERIVKHAPLFLSSRAEARTYAVEELTGDEATEFRAATEFGDGGALEEWRGARVLFERVEPEPHVVVCGAGHVGAALARLAAATGYRVTLIDDRADFVARARFPETSIELVAADSWTQPLRESIGAGRGVAVAVVTRGHNEDEECMRAVLEARPDYAGMIGSRRRTNIVLERLRAAGFDEALLSEVRAPIGLDIGAATPEEVALSILAEIVAERRGGTGTPLSAWRRGAKSTRRD